MKSIITSDKANKPYGFAQLDANANIPGDVTASYAATASYALSGGSIDTSSLATTGSNLFIGVQAISGSNGILLYGDVLNPEYPTLADIHAYNANPWLERFYNDSYSTSSAVMAYFGWDDGRFVFHNESTESIGIQVNGYYGENGLLVYEDKVAFVNNIEVTGSIYLCSGSIISESGSTTVITPSGALPGQSLVIRPTAPNLISDHPSGFYSGDTITITFSPSGGTVTGTGSYTFTGCTEVQLGTSLTGSFFFDNEVNQSLTWTVPILSDITGFTFEIYNFATFVSNSISLSSSGSSEHSHIHLISGDPTTVDIYLGDDDQYIKIEKNAGNVVIGTNLDTNQWIFDTSGSLTTPGSVNISGSTQITGSLSLSTGHININDNAYFLNGANYDGSPVELIGVTATDTVRLGGSGNLLDIKHGVTITGSVDITGSLIVNDLVKLQVRTADPDSPIEGMIIASGSAGASILYYYNGSTWNALF